MVRRMILIGLSVCFCAQIALAQPVTDEEIPRAAHSRTSSGNEHADRAVWSDAGWGVLATTVNIVYMPVKIVYAGLGLVTGGLAYILTVGDAETAQKIWNPSLGGHYVITPAMLHGDEPILFNGPSYSTD